jgi:hypothetical protein
MYSEVMQWYGHKKPDNCKYNFFLNIKSKERMHAHAPTIRNAWKWNQVIILEKLLETKCSTV